MTLDLKTNNDRKPGVRLQLVFRSSSAVIDVGACPRLLVPDHVRADVVMVQCSSGQGPLPIVARDLSQTDVQFRQYTCSKVLGWWKRNFECDLLKTAPAIQHQEDEMDDDVTMSKIPRSGCELHDTLLQRVPEQQRCTSSASKSRATARR